MNANSRILEQVDTLFKQKTAHPETVEAERERCQHATLWVSALSA